MIDKTNSTCDHSWCPGTFKIANVEGKYPMICRKCGDYKLMDGTAPTDVEPQEFYSIEAKFSQGGRGSDDKNHNGGAIS